MLVGTVAIETSELVSRMLSAPACRTRCSTPRTTSAGHHHRPGGPPGSVTIATNMAGAASTSCSAATLKAWPRGTAPSGHRPDGNPQHDWIACVDMLKRGQDRPRPIRAVDHHPQGEVGRNRATGRWSNPCRRAVRRRHRTPRSPAHRQPVAGRSGRLGDPGASRFYLSMGDDLMRRFGGERISGLMERLGVEDDMPIEAGLVSKAINADQGRRPQLRHPQARPAI